MEDPRRSTDRWLVPLAVALIAEALLAGLPWIEKYRATEEYYQGVWNIFVLYFGQTLFPALFGVMTLVALRKPAASRIALIFAFAAIVGMQLSFLGWGFNMGNRVLWMFQPLSEALIAAATPFLWGSALARNENPGSAPLQKPGRIAAGLIQLGFVFRFVARIAQGRGFGSIGSSAEIGVAIYYLGDIVESLILIWATVESLRTVPDEAAVVHRAERVHKLMRAWVVVVLALALVQNVVQVVQSRKVVSLAHGLWTLSVFITLQLTAAFVIARCYRILLPPSSLPMQRSGGVQSTGELS